MFVSKVDYLFCYYDIVQLQSIMITVGGSSNLLGGTAVVGVTVNWDMTEKSLKTPFELMAATATSNSALGAKPCSVTLVPEIFTVV